MIFHQLFETESSTYTYLLACEQTREAILIDPVLFFFKIILISFRNFLARCIDYMIFGFKTSLYN